MSSSPASASPTPPPTSTASSRCANKCLAVKLVVNVDGGARGNPGPAAIGVVVSDPDGTVLQEIAEGIGLATNNVAEYRALLRGVAAARKRLREMPGLDVLDGPGVDPAKLVVLLAGTGA
ncbi:MAG: reverse transcriptase-like protein, partial [Solirubrobacterales bacterium]|nr:reverse transcriptase-like protein [Solirubrobacterales bacterium]